MSSSRPPAPGRDHALFLDVDGTLLEIAGRPDAVVVPPALPGVLARLMARLDGAVALLSGRSLATLRQLLPVPGLGMIGSHGAESTLWQMPQPPPLPASVVQQCREAAARWPGALVEPKPFGIALHWRGCPQAEGALRCAARELAASLGLGTRAGHCVIELTTTAQDKGTALRRAMEAAGWRGRLPVMVGDDEPDFAAMEAARQLGGFSIHVTQGPALRATYRLGGPADVITWLTQLN